MRPHAELGKAHETTCFPLVFGEPMHSLSRARIHSSPKVYNMNEQGSMTLSPLFLTTFVFAFSSPLVGFLLFFVHSPLLLFVLSLS